VFCSLRVVMPSVVFVAAVLGRNDLGAQGGQPSLTAGVVRDIVSGDAHEYEVRATAGDLVSGVMELRNVAALLETRDAAGALVSRIYFPDPAPSQQRRVGFVADATGTYRVSIKAADGFEGGTQIKPAPMVPVTGQRRGSYTLGLAASGVADRMRDITVPVTVNYPSPRLGQLAREIERGQRDALAAFWREVEGKGPLVEAIEGNDRELDVTFLWREHYETRNVLLLWSMGARRPNDYYFSKLPSTDVWYKTLRLRRDSRLLYTLSPNDRPGDRVLTRRIDPLHARVYPDDPTYSFVLESVVELPDAPDQSWALRSAPAKGTVIEQRFISELLKNEREIWIYTPPGYNAASGPYPFVLLFDGAAYVSPRFLNAPGTLDNLIAAGRIRPAIVCFLDPVDRETEQAFGGAGAYGDAIVRELMPMLRTKYAITTAARDMVVGGFSNGGLAAALVALNHPMVFGNVLAQSGGFRAPAPGSAEPNSISQMFLESSRVPVRFYLEVGSYDNVQAGAQPLHELVLDETNLMGNRHFRDVLRAKGYDVMYREMGAGHDMLHWRAMLADGLMALLPAQPN